MRGKLATVLLKADDQPAVNPNAAAVSITSSTLTPEFSEVEVWAGGSALAL